MSKSLFPYRKKIKTITYIHKKNIINYSSADLSNILYGLKSQKSIGVTDENYNSPINNTNTDYMEVTIPNIVNK